MFTVVNIVSCKVLHCFYSIGFSLGGDVVCVLLNVSCVTVVDVIGSITDTFMSSF